MANLHLFWLIPIISHGGFSNASSSIARFNPGCFKRSGCPPQNTSENIKLIVAILHCQVPKHDQQLNLLVDSRISQATTVWLLHDACLRDCLLDWWNSGPGKCRHENDVTLSIVTDHSGWQLVRHQSSTKDWPGDPSQTVQPVRSMAAMTTSRSPRNSGMA